MDDPMASLAQSGASAAGAGAGDGSGVAVGSLIGDMPKAPRLARQVSDIGGVVPGAHVDVDDVATVGQLFVTSGGAVMIQDGNVVCCVGATSKRRCGTVAPRGVVLLKGVHYYEVVLLKGGGRVTAGWGTSYFCGNDKRLIGVGDDDFSWGFNHKVLM
jgi:hypothetical protein